MRVAVLGAGVVGVTTAYYLAELGHSVTVFDSATAPAGGASGDNGAQLSYSFTDALAAPAFLLKMPGIMAGRDPAFLLRPEFNTSLVRWGLGFLGQCTQRKFRANTLKVLQLAMRSASLIRDLQHKVPIDFSFRKSGKLVMLANRKQEQSAIASIALKRAAGCEMDLISPGQAAEIEPALKGFSSKYIGAIWSQGDEVGDTRAFTTGLADWLAENRGVELCLGAKVDHLVREDSVFTGIKVAGERLHFDAAVVCLGACSRQLLKPLGIRPSIYPVRGYSVTLRAGTAPSTVSITDLSSKIVFSRLDEQIRIAGFADFTGFRTGRDKERTRELVEKARTLAPGLADFDQPDQSEWAGFRPMTPDSRPLVGPTPIRGLFLNTGHGMLGWTLACATGQDIAQEVHASSV